MKLGLVSRAVASGGLLVAALGVAASPATAAPTNDQFADAVVIDDTPFYRSGTMEGATSEPGEPDHSGTGPGATVWFSWTAPSDAVATVRSYLDTPDGDEAVESSIAVYTGNRVADLTYVAGGGHYYHPTLSFGATAGRTYKIAIWGPAGTDAISDFYLTTQTMSEACTVMGTPGDDRLVGTGDDDVVCGLGGDDRIRGLDGNDTLIGGAGTDTASFAGAAFAITATSLGACGQGNDTFDSIENLVGSSHADTLSGGAGANVVKGRAGDDGLWGQGGDDTILGGRGRDTTGGGVGDDQIDGGAGTDTVYYGGPVAVEVNLVTGSATGEGADVLSLLENITGSSAADTLTGSNGVNAIAGGPGSDVLRGQGGNDTLRGADGNDTLSGDEGADRCQGGTGTDVASTCETTMAIP